MKDATASTGSEFSQVKPTPGAWPLAYRCTMWGGLGLYAAWLIFRYGARSLGLDETLTAWATNAGLRACVRRVFEFQGQSPLYFVLVLAVRQVLGGAEFALRTISLLSVVGSSAVVYAILGRLNLRDDAWIGAWASAIVLLSDPSIGFNARPYALAVFFSLLALYFLLGWVLNASWLSLAAYVAALASTILLHYVFAAVIAFHLFVLWQLSGGRKHFAYWLGGLGIASLILLPFVAHLKVVAQKSKRYEFAVAPDLGRLACAIVSLPYIVPLLIIVLAFGVAFRPRARLTALRAPAARIAVCWWVIAPILFFVAYYVLNVSLFVSRYWSWREPAVALLLVAGLRVVYPHRLVALPAFLALAAFAASVFGMTISSGYDEGWREAVAWTQSQSGRYDRLVLYSELIETADAEWLEREDFQPYLTAPIRYYGWTGPASVLPVYLPRSRTLFDEKLDLVWQHNERPVFVMRDSEAAGIDRLIATRGKAAGFEVVDSETFGAIHVLLLRRRSARRAGRIGSKSDDAGGGDRKRRDLSIP